jgi:hypothetical protein
MEEGDGVGPARDGDQHARAGADQSIRVNAMSGNSFQGSVPRVQPDGTVAAGVTCGNVWQAGHSSL